MNENINMKKKLDIKYVVRHYSGNVFKPHETLGNIVLHLGKFSIFELTKVIISFLLVKEHIKTAHSSEIDKQLMWINVVLK